MNKRKKNSGGQAIVMVTLSLFSMMGMMGLAVDLGWSYFSQKQAQAAADSAALAAAQEAVVRLGSNPSGFGCASTGTGQHSVECTETAGTTTLEYCGSSVTSTSNLNSGCRYAKRNGFQYDVAGSKQIVSMQSGDVTDINAPGGVKRISYWVRARTIQTIPQLFSFVAGNQNGTVAANATAAIAGTITPGQFFGLNHAGDCWSLPGAAGVHCGMDLENNAKGNAGSCGTGSGTLCAPGGIALGSTCNSVSSLCSDGFAGAGGTHHGVVTSSLLVAGTSQANGGLTTGDFHNANGVAVTPTYSPTAAGKDPTQGIPQPPIQATNPIPSCGILNGNLSSTTQTFGPFQYYSYSTTLNSKPVPNGNQINIGTATFSSTGTCPGVLSGGVPQTGSFPSFIFYGGLSVGGTMNLTAGQYVMAGVNSNAANSTIFSAGGTIQPGDASATSTGTMFIFTDGSYPGLGGPASQGNTGAASGQISALPNANMMPALYQGSITLKNPSITMDGLENGSVGGSALPSSMNAYTGVVWWQDRRNSMVEYNQCTSSSVCNNPTLAPNCASCTKDDGTVVGCADQSAGQCKGSQTTGEIVTDNHVTSTSPGIMFDPGNGHLALKGVFYQPRGAWMQANHGTGFSSGDLELITGSFVLTTGNDKLLLTGLSNPLISYKAVLIQ